MGRRSGVAPGRGSVRQPSASTPPRTPSHTPSHSKTPRPARAPGACILYGRGAARTAHLWVEVPLARRPVRRGPSHTSWSRGSGWHRRASRSARMGARARPTRPVRSGQAPRGLGPGPVPPRASLGLERLRDRFRIRLRPSTAARPDPARPTLEDAPGHDGDGRDAPRGRRGGAPAGFPPTDHAERSRRPGPASSDRSVLLGCPRGSRGWQPCVSARPTTHPTFPQGRARPTPRATDPPPPRPRRTEAPCVGSGGVMGWGVGEGDNYADRATLASSN